MKFSYNWLKDYVKKLPKPEKLAELLTMHSFEVGEVKKIGQDWVLDIDVLPNRAGDCFSHLGVARECSALTISNFQFPISKLKEDKNLKAKDFVAVEVKNKRACPRYTIRVVTDVKVGSSPKWLKNRLKLCGLKPINNIVDIANYVMLETGQPLHAFDGQKLEGEKIIVRFAGRNEKIVTLDGKKHDLGEGVLVIADEKKPVAIAGIKGGKIPEIDDKTKIVVLESANFSPGNIRKGSRKLNLKTDASIRFEQGIDPNLTEIAINRAASLIQEVAFGKVAQGLIDFYPKKVFPKRIRLDLNYVERLLGIKISAKEIKKILEKLGFKIMGLRNPLVVEVPTWRLDISIPEDLIEEIGRIYGYQKIKPVFPMVSLISPKRNLNLFWGETTKGILKEAGFTEAYNYSFTQSVSQSQRNKDSIEIENPISSQQKYLRTSLIPNLLMNLELNRKYFTEIKLFELGKVFSRRTGEKMMLGGVVANNDFYFIKGVIEQLLNKLVISNIRYIESAAGSALVKVGQQKIGQFNKNYFELDFDKLSQLASEEQEYRPFSKFPAAVRDLAVLVPGGTKVVEVLNKINASGGKIIRDVDLFDIYEGEELPGGKKNLAFHIIYQAENRTLSSKEINEIQDKIIKTLEKDPTWQVRK